MAIEQKYIQDAGAVLRDVRPLGQRFAETARDPTMAAATFGMAAIAILLVPPLAQWPTLVVLVGGLYFWWLTSAKVKLPMKLPSFARVKDPNGEKGKAEGILYLGNQRKTNAELWLSNSDARTHILYLGTTGAGKTEGLKSIVSNTLCWGSGFTYVDGKADTDLWASLFALARRFGRDDDLLVLNYMTGNSDAPAPSNSLNPFSQGSASYLVNLMTGLMDEAGDENAMWKGRAISLMSALMPILTYRRDKEGLLLDVGVVRDHLELDQIVKLSRDRTVPPRLAAGLSAYLKTLPGYIDEAFADDGKLKPPGPNDPAFDVSTVSQQHGFLTMQFTRALQSLSDDYGYIFKHQVADIDMVDVVLNRRILVVLIPALEKSADEAANLGKIIAAAIKGMMGSTLGAAIEGDWQDVIENKPTRAPSPYMTVFDEVGYYTAQGMAVMAAQARSLGFSLVFAAQDLPAMEKRVKEEARSITANCNLKLFGKLEDATDTREFFNNTVGQAIVTQVSGFSANPTSMTRSYFDRQDASVTEAPKARFGDVKKQKPGEVHLSWGSNVLEGAMFYAAPKKVKALRIQKMLRVRPDDIDLPKRTPELDGLIDRLTDPTWTAKGAGEPVETGEEIAALAYGFTLGRTTKQDLLQCGMLAVASLADLTRPAGEAAPPAPPPLAEPEAPPAGRATDGAPPPTAAPPVSGEASPASPPARAAGAAGPGLSPEIEAIMRAAADALTRELSGGRPAPDPAPPPPAPAPAAPPPQAQPATPPAAAAAAAALSLPPEIDAIMRAAAQALERELSGADAAE